MYEIEKGVPVPPLGGTRDREGLMGALRAMAVGDSMVVPLKSRNDIVGNFALRLGVKFTTRKISDTEARIWRIE